MPGPGLNRGGFAEIPGIRVKSMADRGRNGLIFSCDKKAGFNQSPVPGAGEKYFSNLPSMPSKSLASAGDSFFWVIFGQLLAYSVFTSSHFSSPGSVSGLMASAGHSGSQTPQSMHSSGWITSMLSPS